MKPTIKSIAGNFSKIIDAKTPTPGRDIRLTATEVRTLIETRDYLNQLAEHFSRGRTGRPRRFASDAERIAYHNARRKKAAGD